MIETETKGEKSEGSFLIYFFPAVYATACRTHGLKNLFVSNIEGRKTSTNRSSSISDVFSPSKQTLPDSLNNNISKELIEFLFQYQSTKVYDSTNCSSFTLAFFLISSILFKTNTAPILQMFLLKVN